MSFMMQAGMIKFASQGAPETDANDTSKFTNVDFPTPFPEGSKVLVIPAVQSFNGPDSPGLRITDVTRKGFKARMNELVGRKPGGGANQLSDGNHTAEIIGYIAVAI